MNSPREDDLTPAVEKSSNGDGRPLRKLGDVHKTITMAQIAKAAGVSQGAISSLLNDRDYGIRVSEKTRERVFKVCRDMGYVPNDLRAVVRMYPELGEFCLLISTQIEGGLRDPMASRLTNAVMEAVQDPAHALIVAVYDAKRAYSSDSEDLPSPIRAGVASKFLFHGEPNPSLVQILTRRGLPVVSLGVDAPLPGVLSLTPDYAEAALLAIQHLLELGHRQIGIVSGPFGTSEIQVLELHRGIKLAYDRAGIPIEAQNIVYGDLSQRAGAAALEQMMAHPLPPTAVFCLSDAAAAGVMAQAYRRGLQVPEQLSIIGCGNDVCGTYVLPPLTTVHLPLEEIALEGVREVERLIPAGVPAEPIRRTLPVRLQERGSTARPAAGDGASKSR